MGQFGSRTTTRTWPLGTPCWSGSVCKFAACSCFPTGIPICLQSLCETLLKADTATIDCNKIYFHYNKLDGPLIKCEDRIGPLSKKAQRLDEDCLFCCQYYLHNRPNPCSCRHQPWTQHGLSFVPWYSTAQESYLLAAKAAAQEKYMAKQCHSNLCECNSLQEWIIDTTRSTVSVLLCFQMMSQPA